MQKESALSRGFEKALGEGPDHACPACREAAAGARKTQCWSRFLGPSPAPPQSTPSPDGRPVPVLD